MVNMGFPLLVWINWRASLARAALARKRPHISIAAPLNADGALLNPSWLKSCSVCCQSVYWKKKATPRRESPLFVEWVGLEWDVSRIFAVGRGFLRAV